MSMESDTSLQGVTPESGDERVKQLKSESEPQPEQEHESKSESDSEPELDWDWKKEEEELDKAIAVYKKRSRNLTKFDAIDPPEGFAGGVGPIHINDYVRPDLISLSKLALDKYNADNQENLFSR